jgi:purine-cytosine permease-like protein
MIPWWWAVIALIIGELLGVWVVAMCSANSDDDHKYIK